MVVMKITRKQLRKLIQEAMSKEEKLGKLDKLAGRGEEAMMQAASLADALPNPETLDIDNSYEYRRKLINKLVTRRHNLTANLKDLSSDAGGMMSPVFQRAEYYSQSHSQQYPDAYAFKMAEQDIQQEKAELEDKIAKLELQIQSMIDDLGMDPATAHISSLSEATIRRLIHEVATELSGLSDNEKDAVDKTLEKEGGAAGPKQIAQAVRDADEDDDASIPDERIIAKVLDDETIKQHKTGLDIIDTKGISERKKRKTKKKKKKSKKRNRLYPYVYGTHYDGLDHVEFGDYGVDGGSFDGGGDGGGGGGE
jgi:hypothetical protein